MITEHDLARECDTRTYQRARQIAAHGKNMLTKQVRYQNDETTLSAFVAASSGWNDRYRTSVVIDEHADAVVDFSCTCPAFLKYDGMCKHTVALALSYLEDPAGFMGYKEHRSPETSPSIAAFMRRAERASGENGDVPVTIDFELTYGFENWSAHFKLRGPRGSYVMKNTSDFAHALRQGAHVSYGKKLSFTHVLSAFDGKGKALAGFIERAVSARERGGEAASWRSFAQGAARRARATGAPGRDLDLTDAEVIELVDLADHDPIDFSCTDASARTRMKIHVVDADPRIPLRILREEQGGYVIARDETIVFAADADRMYVLQDDMLFKCSPSFARCAGFLRDVYRSGDDKLFVTAADMPLFCATVLPVLEETMALDTPPEIEFMKPTPGALEFYFDRDDDRVEVRACVRYGKSTFTLVEPRSDGVADGEAKDDDANNATELAPLRDEVLENRACELVFSLFGLEAVIPINEEEALADLLFGGLARFRSLGEVFTTPAFDRLVTDRKPRVQIGLSIAGNLIDLDVSAGDLDRDELAALLASYRKRKRYHRLKTGVFLSLEDYDLSQLDHLLDDLDVSPRELASGSIEVPTYRAFYLDREFSEAHRDRSFTDYIDRFHAVDADSFTVPPSLAGVLRPYQREGFTWLSTLTELDFGGILADEMGLGKSLQLISLLLSRPEDIGPESPALIICPASLVYNWVAEFATFAPALDVVALEGGKADRARIRRESHDVLVTSYDLARVDVESLERMRFSFCVLDEAQYIKNHATLTTRAIKRIRAERRFALTGTPMENRLSEIWSIFDFLMPGFLGSYARFRERFELGILGGDEELARRLRSLVGPFILRRSKSAVLPELPEKLDSVVYVPLAGEQSALYHAAEQRLREDLNVQKKNSAKRTPDRALQKTRIEVLAELTRLRQIALDPSLTFENYDGPVAKTAAIVDLVSQTCDAGGKALVFSQFTSYLATIADELDRQGIAYYTITGATPKKARIDLVNAFNVDDVPIFLISLKAGGTGLNLTGASTVIHADPWWNAAATDQATDRAHRIGQTEPVNVYKIIAKGTIEERILRLQEAKSDLAASVVGDEGALTLASLTREELIELLEG
mgnify:FL=1